ncbi:MAG: response regulator transcription factor [Myxococcota bacterium]
MSDSNAVSVALVTATPGALVAELSAQGLRVELAGRDDALELFITRRPDAVLLEAAEASLVPTLRRAGARAVVLLGCDDEACVDTALHAGADDFVLRASGAREIALRLRSVLVKQGVHATLSWNVERKRFMLGPRELDLSPIESSILGCLFENAGFVCTREELGRYVWAGVAVHSRTLDNHVMRLREKLGAASAGIEAVRGVGYRLSRKLASPGAPR